MAAWTLRISLRRLWAVDMAALWLFLFTGRKSGHVKCELMLCEVAVRY